MLDIELKHNSLSNYFESIGYSPVISEGKKQFKVFSSVESEFNSITKGVGFHDISDNGIIEFRGKDSLDFLHRISTNSLKELSKGNLAQTVFTNDKGKIIDTAIILNFEDHQLLICSESNHNKVTGWLNKYIIADDVKINSGSGNYSLIEILGQQADSFLSLVCGNVINDIKLNQFKTIFTEGLAFILAKMKELNGHDKFLIIADDANAVQLAKFMIEHYKPFNFNLIGNESYDLYRISTGLPASPNELNDHFNPHEAGILDLVSFTKGCYIGQEVISRLDTYDKVQRYLRRLTFNQPVNIGENYLLFNGGNEEVGELTSISGYPKSNIYSAMGYVKKAFANHGNELIAKSVTGNSFKVLVNYFSERK